MRIGLLGIGNGRGRRRNPIPSVVWLPGRSGGPGAPRVGGCLAQPRLPAPGPQVRAGPLFHVKQRTGRPRIGIPTATAACRGPEWEVSEQPSTVGGGAGLAVAMVSGRPQPAARQAQQDRLCTPLGFPWRCGSAQRASRSGDGRREPSAPAEDHNGGRNRDPGERTIRPGLARRHGQSTAPQQRRNKHDILGLAQHASAGRGRSFAEHRGGRDGSAPGARRASCFT